MHQCLVLKVPELARADVGGISVILPHTRPCGAPSPEGEGYFKFRLIVTPHFFATISLI